MSKYSNIDGMPIRPKCCASCPFGPNGVAEIRVKVMERVLTKASQTCHSSGSVNGKADTKLCRGARNYQLEIFHRIGMIEAPTDEAWEKKWNEVKLCRTKKQ